MELLLTSIAALFIGPLVALLAGNRQGLLAAMDAFVVVVIGGLLLFHIFPDSFAVAGWWAAAAALAGLALPVAGHHLLGHAQGPGERLPLVVIFALIAIGIHAVFDGIALTDVGHAVVGHEHGHVHQGVAAGAGVLPLAVVLHRVPLGLVIWWIVRPALGMRMAITVILLIVGCTIAGQVLGAASILESSGFGLAIFQAIMAGSLLHVVTGHPPRDIETERHRALSALGAIAGVALLWGMVAVHPPLPGAVLDPEAPIIVFLRLGLESAPALLLAYLTISLFYALKGESTTGLFRGRSKLGQAAAGVAVGLPLPVCSCGVIPLYEGLVRKGAPMTAAIAFLIATPELEVAALLLSFQLLGPEITVARLVIVVVLAFGASLLMGRILPDPPIPEAAPDDEAPGPFRQRLRAGLREGFIEFVDSTAPWILAGLGVAALASPVLSAEWIAGLPRGLDVWALALIGMPVYVCASGSTPLAAVMIAQGISPGAALAFLLTGPATNVTTIGVLSRLHGRRGAVAFALIVGVSAVLLGYAVNLLLPAGAGATAAATERFEPSWFELACGAALALIYAAALFRQGVRGFLANVIPSAAGSHGAEPDT